MYGKIFSQMYTGTLGTRGPWQALVTFQQMIVLANKHGEIDMTAEAISRLTTIPLEIIEIGLRELVLPDVKSRSPDEEGRRIVLIDSGRSWGWRVVNYDHYRKIRSEEDRREYHKLYARERRAKEKESTDSVNDSQQFNPQSTESTKALGSKQEAKDQKKEHSTAKRGARIMDGFQPSPESIEWLRTHRPDLGAKELTEGFVDYWQAEAGAKACKLDWDKTWRNWARRQSKVWRHNGTNQSQDASGKKPIYIPERRRPVDPAKGLQHVADILKAAGVET